VISKAIVIGAGRGRRLEHLTAERPKCLVPIGGKPMLGWVLDALSGGGLSDFVFIGGYRMDAVRASRPDLRYVENRDWARNNILHSLFCAAHEMDGGFVSSYADIVYRPEAVRAALGHPGDVVLVSDVAWRKRYLHRSRHPETDAEKLVADGDRVVRLDRPIAPEEASGEFIGVAKFTARGAAELRRAFAAAALPASAYLIELLAYMIGGGVEVHKVDTPGEYMEIDTVEDHRLAEATWR
jgi:choline kinase